MWPQSHHFLVLSSQEDRVSLTFDLARTSFLWCSWPALLNLFLGRTQRLFSGPAFPCGGVPFDLGSGSACGRRL